MVEVRIDATDFDEFGANLTTARQNLAREQRRALKHVGEQAAAWSRAKARSGSPMQRRFAPSIRASSTQNAASILVPQGREGRAGGAAVAYWGARALTRSGWNAAVYAGAGNPVRARQMLPGARPQFPAWVGNRWIAGRRGEGPYAINEALADHVGDIDQMVIVAYRRATAVAFGEGRQGT